MKIDELKGVPVWINWNYENIEGKQTKVPYAYNGKKTGTTDYYQKDWCDYATAKVQVDDNSADGIGLTINEFNNIGKSLVVIDIDHRSKEDFIVQDVISLMDTYTEISPSGAGFHLLFIVDTAKLPADLKDKYYMKNTHLNIECYIGGITNRYMTFTENVLINKDIEERTQQLMQFLNTYMIKNIDYSNVSEEAKADIVVNNNVPTNNQVILNIIKKSNQWTKFAKLFYDGDISDYNEDDSSADMALADILAYYIGNDVERIAVIMKQSALYRVKYERKDYLEGTIKKSIALHQGNFFNWNGVPTEEQRAIQVNKITTQTAKELQQANIEPPVPIVENLLYPRF